MKVTNTIHGAKTKVTDGFWKSRMDMVARDLIPYQWSALNDEIADAEPSHSIENFRIAAGESGGEFMGTIFQDSDVAKWIEAASFTLIYKADPDLERRLDEVIRLIGKAQQADGYLNTYFTVAAPEKRWKDLVMGHEMYCAGHMIEAAVAHKKATGKNSLIDIVSRYADYIGTVFGPGEGQNHSFCGHPEIELALYKLAEATGNVKYRDLADHFVDVRGTVPNFHDCVAAMAGMIGTTRWFQDDYYLAHKPVRQQHSAEGHSVRAMYLYTAMADYYLHSRDPALLDALRDLWDSTTQKRMYVTAGLGSQYDGERFTVDYDLPPDRAYAETCASIGLVFWAWRMLQIDPDAKYADVIERSIYNGALSGLSLDGTRYFYVNPLETNPHSASYRHDQQHVKTARVPWFGCSCCPPNIARMIASIDQYVATADAGNLWIHQYMSSVIAIDDRAATGAIGDRAAGENLTGDRAAGGLAIHQKTNFPWDGTVTLAFRSTGPAHPAAAELQLNVRIPDWCTGFSLKLNGQSLPKPQTKKGYAAIDRVWKDGDILELVLDMPVRFVSSHPAIADTAGKVAVQRGPLVYCAEETDNNPELHNLVVDPHGAVLAQFEPGLMGGTTTVSVSGYRIEAGRDKGPYGEAGLLRSTPRNIKLVPYHRWGNRKPGQEMRVWIRSKL